jgi:6-phosphogluconolactonase
MIQFVKICSAVTFVLSIFATPLRADFVYVANEDGNSIAAYRTVGNGLKPIHGSPFSSGKFPVSLAVNVPGRILYAVNMGDDTVSAYRIRPNGELALLAVSNAGIMPYGSAVDPYGRFLYVTNIDTPGFQGDLNAPVSHVSAYRIGINGSLSPVPGSPFPAGYSPLCVVADPSGRFVYVGNAGSQDEVSETVSGYSVSGNGTLKALAGSPYRDGESPQEIAADPFGRFVYTAGEYDLALVAYGISVTGIPMNLPASSFRHGTGFLPDNSIAADPFGRFVFQSSALILSRTATIYTYRVSSSGLALSSTIVSNVISNAMAVNPSGQYLYSASPSGIATYRIAGNGNLSLVAAPLAPGFSPQALAVSP